MDYKINMPHHYEIIYQDSKCKLSFETELAVDGVIFYEDSHKLIEGKADDINSVIARVSEWLGAKFDTIHN